MYRYPTEYHASAPLAYVTSHTPAMHTHACSMPPAEPVTYAHRSVRIRIHIGAFVAAGAAQRLDQPRTPAADVLAPETGVRVSGDPDFVPPGAHLADIWPALRYWPEWLPCGGFHATTRAIAKHMDKTLDIGLDHVKVQMFLEGGHDEYLVKWAAGSVQTAGSDTVCTPSTTPSAQC
ncbi:hypothetical protein GGX14DRAFT_397526 [Mycena pura]|uniref:Uncharacterized protein n=1 Tax=Mycena pura TaxID=153505 RepID=A0AAD6V8X9_9AGAR|nr:hypothetical protein GGX14DRAFT_397526 [Mycena pura]